MYKNKLLTSSLKQRLKVPPRVQKEDNRSPKARAGNETDVTKVQKGFKEENRQE